MNDKKTVYVVNYPDISPVIHTEVVDKSYNPPTLPTSLRTENWQHAHEFLLMRARMRLIKATTEMNEAVKHLDSVLQLKDPTK